ncbi:class I SAM-dependent methyltransferase [Noviherbaspirillum saxi]|nr:methyltransferase domain-containing protein [Noviherbaspirillum saxi]
MKQIALEDVVKTYRRYAPFYDRLFGAVLEPGRRALADVVCKSSPASILEVGVGTGLMLSRYPADSSIVGVDVSSEMLEVAGKRIKSGTTREIHLIKMDAETMNFYDAHFDCVTVPYVLSVTPNPDKLIAEIRRVCRKGGLIFILNHFSGSHFWWFLERAVRSIADKIGFRSDFGFDEQILKHDWEVLSVKNVNFLGLSKLVVIRNV